MKDSRILMGMPVTIEIADRGATAEAIERVFAYFSSVEERFSTYKQTSEISQINAGRLALANASEEMRSVFALAEATKRQTNGYFDIRRPNGTIDPSGLVKGWAIHHAAQLLINAGFANFYVEAGGDIQVSGVSAKGDDWRVGIRNPFSPEQIVKIVTLRDCGIATSGTYLRDQHIYDPHIPGKTITDIVSLSVIGPNVYEADRFATAAFAMGKEGLKFIEHLNGFEAYMIDTTGTATWTGGFEAFTLNHAVRAR